MVSGGALEKTWWLLFTVWNPITVTERKQTNVCFLWYGG